MTIAPLRILLLSVIVFIGCTKQRFHNFRVMQTGISGETISLLVAETKGHDAAPVGSCSHGFVTTYSRLYELTYSFGLDGHEAGEAELASVTLLQETTGEHSVDSVLKDLIAKGSVIEPDHVRDFLIDDSADLATLRKRFPQWISDEPEPFLMARDLDSGSRLVLSQLRDDTHVFDEAGDFHVSVPHRMDYGTIWDHKNHQIASFVAASSAETPSNLIGFPESATIWRYREGKLVSGRIPLLAPDEIVRLEGM